MMKKKSNTKHPIHLSDLAIRQDNSITTNKLVSSVETILKEACSQGYPRAQFAFKDLMIH